MKIIDEFRYRCRKRALVTEELSKLIIMRYLIAPIAPYVSKYITLKLAWLLSSIILFFDIILHKSKNFKDIKHAFSLGNLRALQISWQFLALAFQDFAIFMRIVKGKETVDIWNVKEINSVGVDELRQNGRSFIVATGHFTRQAYLAVFRKDIIPMNVIQITLPPNPNTGNYYYDRRIELHLGMGLTAAAKSHPDFQTAMVGIVPNFIKALCGKLHETPTALLLNIDAPWADSHKKSHERPFAGYETKKFAMGVLGLAKISACPIVSLVCYIDSHGEAVLQWGDPVYIAKSDTEEQQVKVLDEMLDRIETAIGMRPSQYLMPFGTQRKWNSAEQAWANS